LFLLIAVFQVPHIVAQQADDIFGQRYTTERHAKVEIVKERGKYHGKVVWMDEPETNGKTYSFIIKKKVASTLEVRGNVGVSLIGRTVEWTKANR
jgi:uncharacterized protein (DUF2147 family)